MKRGDLFSWRSVVKTFLTGLFALLPIMVSLAVVVWLVGVAEKSLGGVVKALLPGTFYLPGMGLVLGLALIFLVGLMMQGFVFRKFLSVLEDLVERIPLIKTVYHAVKDLTDFIARSRDPDKKFGQVVMVKFPNIPLQMIGFVTLEDLRSLKLGDDNKKQVAVYLPMSYQIGGYTLLLPREQLTPLDMSIEDGMRFVITAGLSGMDEGKRKG